MTNLTDDQRLSLTDDLGWHDWMVESLDAAVAAEPKMPMPWHGVRTGEICRECDYYIHAGDVVLKGRTRYAHFDCTVGKGMTPVILQPGPQWLGWTDYERWERDLRAAMGEAF